MVGVLNSRSLGGEVDEKSQDKYRIVLGIEERNLLQFFIIIQAVELRSYLDNKNILYKEFHIETNRGIYFKLLDQNNISKVKKMLNDVYSHYPGYLLFNNQLSFSLSFSDKSISFIKSNTIRNEIKIIENRLDEFGFSGETVKRGDKATITVKINLQGNNTEAEKERIEKLITNQGDLMLMEVVDRVVKKERESTEYIMLTGANKNKKYSLRAIPVVIISKVKDARVGFTSNNEAIVTFLLNKYDMKIVSDFTSKNIGKKLAIVLNDKVYEIISINKGFSSRWKGHLSNNFKFQDAHDLAIILRSGAMLAPLFDIRKRNGDTGIETGTDKKEPNPCKSKVFIDSKLAASEAFQNNDYSKSLKLFKKAHQLCPSDMEVESIIGDLKNVLKGKQ